MDKRYITGTSFFVIAVVVAVVFVEPKYKELEIISGSIVDKENEFKGQQVLIQEIEKVIKELSPALADVGRVDEFLPKSKNVADLLVQLDYVSARNGLIIKAIKFANEREEELTNGKYAVIQADLIMAGSYGSFLGFVNDTKNNKHLMDIVLLSISENLDTGQVFEEDEGFQERDPVLNFNVILDVYYQI